MAACGAPNPVPGMTLSRRALEMLATTAVAVAVAAALYLYAVVIAGRMQRDAEQAAVPKAALNQPAPDFTVLTTAGAFTLRSATTPVFLEIFATWCTHCREEVPTIDRLYAAYRGRVAFVGVSGSSTGMDGFAVSSASDVLAWRARYHVSYPIAYDAGEAVAAQYLQNGFPTIAVIDRNKIVRYLAAGEVDYATLDAALRGVLAPH